MLWNVLASTRVALTLSRASSNNWVGFFSPSSSPPTFPFHYGSSRARLEYLHVLYSVLVVRILYTPRTLSGHGQQYDRHVIILPLRTGGVSRLVETPPVSFELRWTASAKKLKTETSGEIGLVQKKV